MYKIKIIGIASKRNSNNNITLDKIRTYRYLFSDQQVDLNLSVINLNSEIINKLSVITHVIIISFL